jgi:hypothetical protein
VLTSTSHISLSQNHLNSNHLNLQVKTDAAESADSSPLTSQLEAPNHDRLADYLGEQLSLTLWL